MECVTHPKLAEANAKVHQFHMGEHLLSDGDCRQIETTYRLWLTLIVDSAQLLKDRLEILGDETGIARCLTQAGTSKSLERLCELDVAYVIKQLKALLQALRSLGDDPWLKNRKSSRWRQEWRDYLTTFEVETDNTNEVYYLVAPFLKAFWRTDDAEVFALCNTIMQFPTRVTLKDVDWILEENIQAYVDFEYELKLNVKEYPIGLLRELRNIISEWFAHVDFSDIRGQHGYGATARVMRSSGTAAKYYDMQWNWQNGLLAEFLDWTPENLWPGLEARRRHAVYMRFPQLEDDYDIANYEWYRKRQDSGAFWKTRVNLVPKGIDKKRVVSQEPTSNMFLQKMLMQVFDRHFAHHPEMRIDLHNQELNKRLALKGSERGDYSTIDLSNASDSVSLTLVEYIFRDTPLYYPLLRCRTPRAELPDGQSILLEKFAPMGSAVCFPVECTVFSAIITAAQRAIGVNRYYRVYGDDMVVHKDVFPKVCEYLSALYFSVNTDKSYGYGSHFTESCGIECYKGQDVSPLRLSRGFDISTFDIFSKNWGIKDKLAFQTEMSKGLVSPQLDGLYKLANEARKRGYRGLSCSLVRMTGCLYPCSVFSDYEEYGFLRRSRSDAPWKRLQMRWNADLQRNEYLCLKYVSEVDPGEDILRYSALLEEYSTTRRGSLSSPDDLLEVRVGASQSYYKWVWLPEEVLINEP